MDFLIESIFINEFNATELTPANFFICIGISIVLGLVIACCYMFRNEYSRNLVISISIMPVIVTILIMLVSGSIGAAIAVGGVFALTRFRSAQGTSKEITQILLAMATGLTLGLGYIFLSLLHLSPPL